MGNCSLADRTNRHLRAINENERGDKLRAYLTITTMEKVALLFCRATFFVFVAVRLPFTKGKENPAELPCGEQSL